jgi:RNA polymerase sigma-70 factor (ECF subfamily)
MTNTPETRELIERAASGDRIALERLLLDHYAPLADRIAQQLPRSLRSTLSVDDVVQQTYVQVFQSICRFELRDDVPFLSWLGAIAECRLRDAVRAQLRKKRGGGHHRLASHSAGDAEPVDWLDRLARDSHTPSRALAREEAIQAIRIALADLPEEYREAIDLRYFEGCSLDEVAVRMNRSPGAVRGLLDRAKKRIRDALGRASVYLSDK